MGILQWDDRRDGQAFPRGTGAQLGAIRLGAVCALSRILSHGLARWLAGNAARLQGRYRCRAAHGGCRGSLVHTCHADCAVLGLPSRRVHHRRRAYLSRDRRQSIHHRSRSACLCGNPHQLGPILQWYRVGVWTDGGRHVFLWHGPHREEHGCGDIVDSLRGGRRRCSAAGRDLCAREVARHHAGRGRSGLIGRSQRNCLSRCAPRTRRCHGLALAQPARSLGFTGHDCHSGGLHLQSGDFRQGAAHCLAGRCGTA